MSGFDKAIRDMQFVLHDVLQVQGSGLPDHAALDPDLTLAVLTEAGRLASGVLAPLNAPGDAEGCRLDDGAVRTPAGFRDAYARICAGGWPALDCPEAHGGQGMPYLMNCATGELFVAANMALNMYQGLTHGAVSALLAHGSEAQKALFLPPLVSGRWTGTMNLTEPQCGTDLGLIRTRAEPAADGSHRITGQKIWISAGEHDLAENIVHLVLARLPDAPEGTRGLSLFVVPKLLPEADGSPGARNAVACVGLERKMGIHGCATCTMQYDGATGWLVGDPHKGMRAMFTMMNEARLGVGLQGLAVASAAHGRAVAFARDRLQGRAAGGPRNPEAAADPILVHPDVRRMLMDQRAFVEGGRALLLWGALLIDRAQRGGDDAAGGLVSLLTPVIKGFLTDRGFEMTVGAQQVFGGAGYIRDTGIEQMVRDVRIAMVYEGTNGIQALDLLGRKLGAQGGRPIMALMAEIEALVATPAPPEGLTEGFLTPLGAALGDLREAVRHFMQIGGRDPEAALSGALDFLHLLGHVCIGLMWTRMALAARRGLAAGAGDAAFLRAKLVTGRHYMAWHLPATALHLARIRSGGETVLGLDDAAF